MFGYFDEGDPRARRMQPVNVTGRGAPMDLPQPSMLPGTMPMPTMSGPSAMPMPAIRSPRRRSLMERLFPTPTAFEGLLSEDDLAGARRSALLRFGSGMLADAGWHPKYGGPTLGQSLGKSMQGAQEGFNSDVDRSFATQQAGAQARASQQHQALREQIARQYPQAPGETSDQTIQRLEKIFAALIAGGDTEAAGKIGEVLKSYGGTRAANTRHPDWEDFGGEKVFMQPNGQPVMGPDGKPIVRAKTPPARDPNAPSTAEQMRDQRIFQREQGLWDDFSKSTSTASASVYILADTLREADRAIAGDIASQQRMMYGFINSMDNSAVRDGERAAVAAAAPLLQQAQVALSKLSTGDTSYTLPPTVLRQMKELMTRRYHGSTQFIKAQQRKYKDTAKRWKVSEERFDVPMPELETAAPAGGAPTASPNFFANPPRAGNFARPPR